jgi:hypothetical protein
MISVADVLKAFSDKRSLALFKIVTLTKPNTQILISKTKLSRKQYYSRMSTLVKAGLTKRINGKYTLTAFGRLINYNALIIMENATSIYWKLKVIDSFEMPNDLHVEERRKIIDSFIDGQKIKDVLISHNRKVEPTGPYDLKLQTRQLRIPS